MNRAQAAEIAEVRQRLVAAAKSEAPLTRRAAQQMSDDLYQWAWWALEGVVLPRLPRRLRVGLVKPVKKAKKKDDRAKKIITENEQKTPHRYILSAEIQNLLAANYGKCRAIAMAIIGRYRLAEECTADCMANALEQLAKGKVKFANEEKFCAWLHTIVRFSARRIQRRVAHTRVGDFLPSKGILPSMGRKDELPGVNEQAERFCGQNIDEGNGNVVIDHFESARVWGRSKRCPTADDQHISFSV
jgi:hypothetical protein